MKLSNLEATKNIKTPIINADKIKIGNKWLISGVGDAYTNDDWLRLFKADGSNGYHGGFAAGMIFDGQAGTTMTGLRDSLQNQINGLQNTVNAMKADKVIPRRWIGHWDVGGHTPNTSMAACINICKSRNGAVAANWRSDNNCWCKGTKATTEDQPNHTTIIFNDR